MKPVNLRLETWELLRKDRLLLTIDDVGVNAAQYAYEAGIMAMPKLLENTVICLESGVEYLITPEAAEAIARDDALIILKRLDGKPVVVECETIEMALANNCEFDQLER